MRIESFWAKGFRSLRDVRLENLGPFNVFYGPNGSGKSNILAAIEAWLELVPIALQTGAAALSIRSDRERTSATIACRSMTSRCTRHGDGSRWEVSWGTRVRP